MGSSSPANETDELVVAKDSVDRRPWGIYVPPVIEIGDAVKDDDDRAQTQAGGGYVRIVDARGKSFPCGFSRPVKSVSVVTADDVMVAGKKRRRPEMSGKTRRINHNDDAFEDEGDASNPTQCESKISAQKVTITEERIHPEEALFLHMRGLLRIESPNNIDEDDKDTSKRKSSTTLTTQDLFSTMLPECKIPLAAYLAYAHLRAQGYILIRYTDQRMKLLCRMQRQKRSTKLGETLQNPELHSERTPDAVIETIQKNDELENDGGSIPVKSSQERFRTRPLRFLLSDDVATAPPPCVVSSHDMDNQATINNRLAYYAYNPNAQFKRSNPGLPNFGVAVVPFRNGPTFDTLNSLVSLVENGVSGGDNSEHTKSGIPLRVVTVADGGAVIAFGVTNGDVPCINQSQSVE
ncbi:hypothetical protein ACHAWU_004270 [Discostella pseudostelligera]|uniref:tRNA-splicing endonuclease subunit Sen54 N-terminal domain-containing protein n=1 Tax=Discostella pseudostelligera TaxID=259834 RepID=A0ABD3M2S9_9STRA